MNMHNQIEIINKSMLGIYARQSRNDGIKESSVVDQINQGKLKASELKLDYKVYQDVNESAAYDSLENRPSFIKLLKDVEDGIIAAVFVYDQSRLSRNATTQLYIKRILSENKVKVYTILDGTIDYEDSDSELMSDIKTLFNIKYIRDTSKKIKSKLQLNVSRGKVGGGLFKSYGYKKGVDSMLVIDEEEAPVIKEIYHLYINGMGTGKIAEYLNKKGIPTKSSKVLKVGLHIEDKYTKQIKLIRKEEMQWAGAVVLEMIKNSIYKGDRKYRGKTYPAPAIIDTETWSLAQKQIIKNKNVGGKITHQYLLNDLLFCGRCGCGYKGRTRESKRDHIYYCTSKNNANVKCGIRSINIDYLNNIVWDMVTNSDTITKLALEEVSKLKNPDYLKELELNKKQLEAQIRLEEQAKSKTLELCKRGVLTLDEAEKDMQLNNTNIGAFKAQLLGIQSKLDNQKNTIKIIDEVKEAQNQLDKIKDTQDFETKQKLVKLFIEKVIINFDDSKQEFTLSFSIRLGTGNQISFVTNDNDKTGRNGKIGVKQQLNKIKWTGANTMITKGLQKMPLSSPPFQMSGYPTERQLKMSLEVNILARKGSNRKKHWLGDNVKMVNLD